MVRILTFGSIKIWLYIQQLYTYKGNDIINLTAEHKYICFFKFTEPTFAIYGEQIVDENNFPKIFHSPEEAEQFAAAYLEERFHFRSDFHYMQ